MWLTGIINDILTVNFNPENPRMSQSKSWNFRIGKRARIQGLISFPSASDNYCKTHNFGCP